MTAISVRDFRNNLASFFNMADKGESVFIRRNQRVYTLVPVTDEDIAIQTAGVTRGRNGFHKDKSGEKLEESEENLLEHRTDGSDAFDTLYIGCEKFPQSMTSSSNVVADGVM